MEEIICGDSARVLKMFSDNYFDLTVTSPPYDNLRTYNGFEFDFESIAKELFRVTKQGGVVVWVVGDSTIDGSESTTSAEQKIYFRKIGFNIHDTMIYRKINYIQLTHNRYEQSFEYMFVFSKGRPNTFNPIKEATKGSGDKYNMTRKGYCSTVKEGAQRRRNENIITNDFKIHANIFDYTLGSARTGHPAPFPESLAKDHIISWSNPNDLVLDCFMGSGTTMKMAKELGRNYVGIDMSYEYCKLSKKRLLSTSVPLFV